MNEWGRRTVVRRFFLRKEIKVGDRLSLLREDNKFDSNAILILTAQIGQNRSNFGQEPR